VVEVRGRVIGVHRRLRARGAAINTSIVEPARMMGTIDSDFIEGVGKLEDRLLILLDLEKLFATELSDLDIPADAA
jgi:purine-binding chemotaxis protein CheW